MSASGGTCTYAELFKTLHFMLTDGVQREAGNVPQQLHVT